MILSKGKTVHTWVFVTFSTLREFNLENVGPLFLGFR